jgi:hypothetical protein
MCHSADVWFTNPLMQALQEHEPVTVADAVALLMRVHYEFLMLNPRFWYEPTRVGQIEVSVVLPRSCEPRALSLID